MATLLEHGGTVELWGGWTVTLPPSYHERNPDGSWSSWGADWAIDVHIIEVGGNANGEPVPAEQMLGDKRTINTRGDGWVGEVALLKEMDSGREVFRLAANLAAINTSFSFWVSYFDETQRPFAEGLVRGIAHVV